MSTVAVNGVVAASAADLWRVLTDLSAPGAVIGPCNC